MEVRKCLPNCCTAEITYDNDMGEENPRILPCLKELCARRLVSDTGLLPKSAEDLPQVLQDFLMEAAVHRRQAMSVLHLLDIWKQETFFLEMPKVFRTWQLFFLQREGIISDRLSHLQSFAMLALNHIVEELYEKQGTTPIRCVDLSRLPVSDTVVRRVCDIFTERLKYSNTSSAETSSVWKGLTIKLNCIVTWRETITDLCSVLKSQRNKSSEVKLIISALCITPYAYCDDVPILLNLLDKDVIEVFHCECWLLENSERYELYNSLKTFCNLRALDVSYTTLDFRREPEYIELLGKALQEMSCLKQLHLNGCRLTNYLHLLIGNKNDSDDNLVPYSSCGRLQHLALAGCGLSNVDLTFLSSSKHADTLRNLDLSVNSLDFKSLVSLLIACKNLRVLEMESCKFSEGKPDVECFFHTLSKMQKVRYLNIGGFESIGSNEVQQRAVDISRMSSLKCLRLSHHRDIDDVMTLCRHGYSPSVREFTERMEEALRLTWGEPVKKIRFLYC